MLLLHHRRFFKLAAGVGIAPTSRALQTRAHLSMPSSENWCVREELHLRCLPKGPGFTDQGDTSGSRLARLFGQGRGTCTHPAGFTGPSANWLHYPLKNGRAGGTCTRDPLLPRQVRWLLRYSPKFVPGHRLHPVPLGPYCSVAREVADTKIGPRGTICTRTGPVLSRMPLLLGYAG